MIAIHRIRLENLSSVGILLTATGPPLSVTADRQGSINHFDLWFEHNSDEREKSYLIYALATGEQVPWNQFTRNRFHHLGTIITQANEVWHIFYSEQ